MYLPWLPTDLARRRRLKPQVPIVLSRCEHQAEIVAAACAQAQARGVRPGMSLAHARALLPAKAAFVAPIDDHGVMDALRRFGVALTRWLPIVAIDGRDGVLADATGCERLYRGIAPLVQTIADRVRRWGLGAKVVAAPTYGAAWAIARYADTCEVVVGPDDLAQALEGLPVESLRLEMGVIEQLRAVGLERVGQVRRVGRAALADRYGPEVLRRLDQAMGLAPETLTPIRTRPDFSSYRSIRSRPLAPNGVQSTGAGAQALGVWSDGAARSDRRSLLHEPSTHATKQYAFSRSARKIDCSSKSPA